MILLDTHAWVWWISNPDQLSAKALGALQKAQRDNSIYISSISAWEVALLVLKGRLLFTMNAADWIAKSETLPFLNFVPVDNMIALRSVHLPSPFHNDPSDRIIIATALVLGATIVTKDDNILRYPHVKAFW